MLKKRCFMNGRTCLGEKCMAYAVAENKYGSPDVCLFVTALVKYLKPAEAQTAINLETLAFVEPQEEDAAVKEGYDFQSVMAARGKKIEEVQS